METCVYLEEGVGKHVRGHSTTLPTPMPLYTKIHTWIKPGELGRNFFPCVQCLDWANLHSQYTYR